jgi:outer membrane biosynthesis protein TonB
MAADKEKRNQQVGAAISIGLHLGILLLFFFLIAWRAPDPPLPEFGIELNFGLDEVGSGDVQPETNASPTESEEEALPDAPEEVQEEVEEVVEDQPVEPEEEEIETEETTDQPVETTDTNVADVPQQEITNQDSQDVVEQPKAKEETKKVEQKPPPVLYPGNKDGASGKTGESSEAQKADHGDNTNKTGDKGVEEGTIDARAIYGELGGGGNSKLEIPGWIWVSEPRPDDKSNESGKIVFEILIDERGEIISVKTLEKSVSNTLVQLYQKEVERLTFTKTSTNSTTPSTTTGKITFTIKAD